MQALAVNRDLIVFLSAIWQTTATAVRAGEEAFLIDSPVLPEELEALPSVLEQAGFRISGLLSTHADWDHLLGRLAFPQASLGCGETTARRLAAEPGEATRALRAFDDEHYLAGRPPLALAGVQELPSPGELELGSGSEREIELHPAEGHTADGTAYVVSWLGTLICGDYLSPVEIPSISSGGSAEQYLATLERLTGLVARVATIVPGHGHPIDRERALEILAQDQAYLRALLAEGAQAPLPDGRRGPTQRATHARNLQTLD